MAQKLKKQYIKYFLILFKWFLCTFGTLQVLICIQLFETSIGLFCRMHVTKKREFMTEHRYKKWQSTVVFLCLFWFPSLARKSWVLIWIHYLYLYCLTRSLWPFWQAWIRFKIHGISSVIKYQHFCCMVTYSSRFSTRNLAIGLVRFLFP